MAEGTYYRAVIYCWRCPFGKGISRQFSVRTWKDGEGVDRWCFARGQKPRGWFVEDDEVGLNFYDTEGNSIAPNSDSVGVIYGLCPECNKDLEALI